MNFIKRFLLFWLVNIWILITIGIILSILSQFFPDIAYIYNSSMTSLFIYAGVVWFSWAFLSLFLSRWMAKRIYNIQLLDSNTFYNWNEQIIIDTVKRISQYENITLPEIGIYESEDINAFATWYSKNNAIVAVSTWLLTYMNRKEVEGVVWHEMAHILNGDMVTMTLLQWVINTFIIVISNLLSRIITQALWKDNGSWVFYIINYILQIILWLLAMFVIMAYSRTREYKADLWWAKYTSKDSMIAWLKKLKEYTEKVSIKWNQNDSLKAFMIHNEDSLFSTHPSLDNRIKKLEESYI